MKEKLILFFLIIMYCQLNAQDSLLVEKTGVTNKVGESYRIPTDFHYNYEIDTPWTTSILDYENDSVCEYYLKRQVVTTPIRIASKELFCKGVHKSLKESSYKILLNLYEGELVDFLDEYYEMKGIKLIYKNEFIPPDSLSYLYGYNTISFNRIKNEINGYEEEVHNLYELKIEEYNTIIKMNNHGKGNPKTRHRIRKK